MSTSSTSSTSAKTKPTGQGQRAPQPKKTNATAASLPKKKSSFPAPVVSQAALNKAVKSALGKSGTIPPARRVAPDNLAAKAANQAIARARVVANNHSVPAKDKEAEKDVEKTLAKFERGNATSSHFHGLHNDGVEVGADVSGVKVRAGKFATFPQPDGSLVVEGTERLQSLTVDGNAAGDILAEALFTPLGIGARLPIVAQTFTTYSWQALDFLYVPSISPANNSANGALEMAALNDPSTELPSDDENGVSDVFAYDNSIPLPIYGKAKLCVDLDAHDQNEMYVDTAAQTDPRLAYVCRGFVMAATEIPASAAIGIWYCRYRIVFTTPVVTDQNAGGSSFGMCICGLQSVTGGATAPVSPPAKLFFGSADNLLTANVFGSLTLWESGLAGYTGDVASYSVPLDGIYANCLVLPAGRYDVVITSSGWLAAACPQLGTAVPVLLTSGVTGVLVDSTTVSAVAVATASTFNGVSPAATVITRTDCYRLTVAALDGMYVQGPVFTNAGANAVSMRLSITGLSNASGALPTMVNSRFINKMIAAQRIAINCEKKVLRLLRDHLAQGPVTPEAYMVCKALMTPQELSTIKMLTMPAFWPLVAGAISWFVSTFGARLGKAACEWGVRKIEEKLA